jgi:hypothetical protein
VIQLALHDERRQPRQRPAHHACGRALERRLVLPELLLEILVAEQRLRFVCVFVFVCALVVESDGSAAAAPSSCASFAARLATAAACSARSASAAVASSRAYLARSAAPLASASASSSALADSALRRRLRSTPASPPQASMRLAAC